MICSATRIESEAFVVACIKICLLLERYDVLICKCNRFFLFMKRGDVVQEGKIGQKDHQRRAAIPRTIVKTRW